MNLHIDRLTLRLAGLSEADGRRLAQLVGDGLATAGPPAPAGAAESDAMDLTLVARPGEALESMARRMVNEMLHGLARTL